MVEQNEYKTESFDSGLIDRAVDKVRKLAEGNGFDTSDIKIVNAESATYLADAITIIDFQPHFKVHTKRIPGTEQVIPATSTTEVEAKAKDKIKALKKGGGDKNQVEHMFKTMPGQGLGDNPKDMPAGPLCNYYKVKQDCTACGSRGRKTCGTCQGQRQQTCPECRGQKSHPCGACNGIGMINSDPCGACQGRRYMTCGTCNGSAILVCPECQGRGESTCGTCNGNGAEETVLYCETTMTANSTINPYSIPDTVKTLIDKIGLKKLSSAQHIKTSFSTDTAKETIKDGFPPPVGQEQLHLYYDTKIPFAEITLALGDTHIDLKILGNKGVMAEIPTFLDDHVSRETEKLKQLGHEKSITLSQIEKTLEYNFSKRAWSLLQTASPKRTMNMFLKNYGLVVDKNLAYGLIKTLHKIKLKSTRGQRYSVYAIIGAALILILFFIYQFFS